VTKEEIIAAIQECHAKLGHVPSFTELQKLVKIGKRTLLTNFGTYTAALSACGLERQGPGYEVGPRSLFLDWAGLTRNMGKIPSTSEYGMRGRYSVRPLLRFCRAWRHVPTGMMEYAKKEGLEGEWGDVMDIIVRHQERKGRRGWTSGAAGVLPSSPRLLLDRPIYGTPFIMSALGHAPTNEAGVIFLFGTVARELGFMVIRVQTEFPDCEAMREVERGRWQRVRIEFEYESRNFVAHMHPVTHCDLIVCWNHNWKDCPLEVLELSRVIQPQTVGADLLR
jgi:Homing endonuclease associated repeat